MCVCVLLARWSTTDPWVERLPAVLLLIVLVGVAWLVIAFVRHRRKFTRYNLVSTQLDTKDARKLHEERGLPTPSPFSLVLRRDFPSLWRRLNPARKTKRGRCCCCTCCAACACCSCTCGSFRRLLKCCARRPKVYPNRVRSSKAVGWLRGAVELITDHRVARVDDPRLSQEGSYAVAVAASASWTNRKRSTVATGQGSGAGQAAGQREGASAGVDVNLGPDVAAPPMQTRLRVKSQWNNLYIGVVSADFLHCTKDLAKQLGRDSDSDGEDDDDADTKEANPAQAAMQDALSELYSSPDAVAAGWFASTPGGWAYFGRTGGLRHWSGPGLWGSTKELPALPKNKGKTQRGDGGEIEVVISVDASATGANVRMRVDGADLGVVFRGLPCHAGASPLHVAVALRDVGDEVEFVDDTPTPVESDLSLDIPLHSRAALAAAVDSEAAKYGDFVAVNRAGLVDVDYVYSKRHRLVGCPRALLQVRKHLCFTMAGWHCKCVGNLV